ncbi:MAG: chitin deacetylase, partial [Planctomycetes bacterium]|nr:chitin deacetylase [Planctomycetota bacterium]
WFLESIRRSLEWTLDNNAVYDFLAHPSCLSVEDPECKIIELICRIVARSQNRGVVTTLDKIAASIAAN